MKRSLLVPLLVAAGCAGADDPEATPSAYAVQLAPADAARLLDFVNYPGTDADLLDHAVGLDVRAAGADGILPSADDSYFADVAALDAVPYVGDTAFAKLSSYAAAYPAPTGESVEGVGFHEWEAQAVVWGVNHDAPEALDALLDARA